MSNPSKRVKLLVVAAVLALLAAACGSSGSDGAEATDDAAEVDGSSGDASTGEAGSDGASADSDGAPVLTGTPDPAVVAQLGAAFLGAGDSPEVGDCLVEVSESDDMFANAVNTLVSGAAALDDAGFASIVTNVRDCAGSETFTASLAGSFSSPEVEADVATCLGGVFDDDGDDVAMVSFAALMVGFPLPAGSEDATVNALGECVSGTALASQLALQYEAGQGGAATVDVACVEAAIAGIDVAEDFWRPAVVSGDPEALSAMDELVSECASGAYDDMLQSVPDDFVPWAGQGALADVAPPARANAYAAAPPMSIDPEKSYRAIITTADGEMVIDLFADTAPITVNSFVNLARDGYYDGVTFHRVLEGFMAQAGDPTGSGSGGPGYSFEDEVDGGPEFDRRGLLAMANSGPATNGSQFFITFVPTPHLNGGHTIFGELVEGDDVLSAVNLRDPAAPTGPAEVIISIVIEES